MVRFVVLDQTHTRITNRDLSSCRMDTRCRSRATEAQTENEDQPQLVIAAKITELRQAIEQQAELIQRQADEARKIKEELARRQNQLLEAFM